METLWRELYVKPAFKYWIVNFQNHFDKNNKISTVVNEANIMFLYEKYADVVYGSILRLTDDTSVANEILIQTFIKLKGKTFPPTSKPLFVTLIQFAYGVTIKYLAKKGIPKKPPDVFAQTYPILNCVLYKAYSLKEASILLSIDVEEIKKKLHDECEMFKTSFEQSTKNSYKISGRNTKNMYEKKKIN